MNVNNTSNNIPINIINTIKTRLKGFKELVEGIQHFFNMYFHNDYDIDKTLKEEKNKDLTLKQAHFFKDMSFMVKKRFDEIQEILKELNINYLLVYSNESKEEMRNNPDKYDIILDCLISRLGVLYAYISIDKYINKNSWTFKYLPCICLQSYKKEDVVFLNGDLNREETKEIITNFLK